MCTTFGWKHSSWLVTSKQTEAPVSTCRSVGQCEPTDTVRHHSSSSFSLFSTRKRDATPPPTYRDLRHWSPLRPSVHVSCQRRASHSEHAAEEVWWWGAICLKGNAACQSRRVSQPQLQLNLSSPSASELLQHRRGMASQRGLVEDESNLRDTRKHREEVSLPPPKKKKERKKMS